MFEDQDMQLILFFGKTFPITSDLGPQKYNGTKGIKPTYSKRTLDAEESSVAS